MMASPSIPLAAGRILFRRPLVSTSAALALIDAGSQEEVVAMIEDGRLRWAWNIGRGARREIRIWGESVNDYLAGKVAPEMPPVQEFAQVIECIFPDQGPDIRAAAIARALNTGTDHVFGLHADGQLTLIAGSAWGTGPSGSPRFQFSSLVEFLKNRRVM